MNAQEILECFADASKWRFPTIGEIVPGAVLLERTVWMHVDTVNASKMIEDDADYPPREITVQLIKEKERANPIAVYSAEGNKPAQLMQNFVVALTCLGGKQDFGDLGTNPKSNHERYINLYLVRK